MQNQNQNVVWQALEYKHYEKNPGWYIALISISILVTGFFIIQKDIFAAITMVILTFFIIVFSRHTPKVVTIELNHKGIKFDNIFYPYKQIKYFWIVNNQNHKTVNFHTNTYINNTVILELEQQDPDVVRDHLLMYLPEHEQTHETMAQKIMHKLKF